ncbi:MAG: hypothetical protein CL398_09925 [Acidiferrobacteraceae bacterium]|nr:hypothetical protein [Acidiferrobacteraceae bacterium]|tara:strand:+ start:1882 stop:2775 length:894 start_codon:yes stop_codon:yes gene_type:complete
MTEQSIRTDLEDVLSSIRDWASQIRQGDFSARLSITDDPIPEGLRDDVNRLAEWLESLAEQQESQLQAQQDRIERQSGHVMLLEERSHWANELHDSLAQTLASLKIQVRLLDDTLRQDNEAAVWREMEKIEAVLDNANSELRGLITQFRAPIDRSGVVPAVEKMISRFRQDSDIEAVFQNQWPEVKLGAERETHVIRIIQEALHNVRRHSFANMVRVLLTRTREGLFRVIIEDDGVGFKANLDHKQNHFGLTVMEDRARRIDGTIRIDSEPYEGTQILFEFKMSQAAPINKPLESQQ